MARQNNGGEFGAGLKVSPAEQLLLCDVLPAPVRDVIKGAHVPVACDDVLVGWLQRQQGGMSARAYAALVAQLIDRARREDALLTYGPTHPDTTR